MNKIKTTKQFERDLKKMKKRGKDLKKIKHIIDVLAHNHKLEVKYRNHKLSGNFRDHWECHIEPDWLLVYRKTADAIILIDTGTHSDLFKT